MHFHIGINGVYKTMKILWFSNNTGQTGKVDSETSIWGWVDSLASAIREHQPDCELYIAYRHSKKNLETSIVNGVNIIRIPFKRNILEKSIALIRPIDRSDLYRKIIDMVNPDVVQVFGTESDYGLLCGKIDIPIVIHMQGILIACKNVMDSLRMEKKILLIKNPLKCILYVYNNRVFQLNVEREKKILYKCRNFIIRTFWDTSMVELLAQNPVCFKCDEVIKKIFRENEWRKIPNKPIKLISIISWPVYKGMNVIYLTAVMLRKKTSPSNGMLLESKVRILPFLLGGSIRKASMRITWHFLECYPRKIF